MYGTITELLRDPNVDFDSYVRNLQTDLEKGWTNPTTVSNLVAVWQELDRATDLKAVLANKSLSTSPQSSSSHGRHSIIAPTSPSDSMPVIRSPKSFVAKPLRKLLPAPTSARIEVQTFIDSYLPTPSNTVDARDDLHPAFQYGFPNSPMEVNTLQRQVDTYTQSIVKSARYGTYPETPLPSVFQKILDVVGPSYRRSRENSGMNGPEAVEQLDEIFQSWCSGKVASILEREERGRSYADSRILTEPNR